jgi:hypothetical protein
MVLMIWITRRKFVSFCVLGRHGCQRGLSWLICEPLFIFSTDTANQLMLLPGEKGKPSRKEEILSKLPEVCSCGDQALKQ